MKSRLARKLILFISAVVLLPSIAFGQKQWSDPDVYKPNPILFLHGFAAGSPASWDKIVYLSSTGTLTNSLRFYFNKYTQVTTINQDLSLPYLERLDFKDPNGSICTYPPEKLNLQGNSDGWADKINKRINTLLPIYTFKNNPIPLKFILICHSMGGLAAREYVTNPKYSNADSYVDKIITIGTPHAGSPLGNVKTIENAMASGYKYIWEVPYWGKTIVIQRVKESDDLIAYVRGPGKIDLEGEAIKDLAVGSPFLTTLNNSNRLFPPNIKKFAIYGELNPLLSLLRYFNQKFFSIYYPAEPFTCGDGIVPRDSQEGKDIMTYYPSRAYWVWQPDKFTRVQADHITELESPETRQALLQFLDSTPPEFEITSPDPNITAEIKDPTIHITGKVYKEYLPADSNLIINVKRLDDNSSSSTQSSLLKASSLWIPNNPDSPVAEFDEVVNFPGSGIYEVSCQVKNPAGLTSEIKKINIKVTAQGTGIVVHCHNPEGIEINSIQGVGNAVKIYDGSTLIGYGASSSATLNKPISLGQGSHTIKAAFNGMTLSQNFTLSSGETKILTFSFTRTSYDIYKWLNNFNISIYGDILDKSPGRYYCEWAWMPRPITIPADWILFNDYQVEKEILNADPGDQDRGFIHNNGGYLRGVNPPWDDFGGPVQIHFNVNIPVGLEGIMVKGIVYFSYSLINGVVTITHHIEINGYHVYSPYELLPDSISDRVYNQTLQTIYSNSIDYPWLNLHPTWYCQNVNPSGNYFGYTNLFTNVPGYFCYIVTNPPLNLFYNVVEDTQVSTFNIIRTPPPGIVFSTVPYDLLGTGIKG